MTKPLAIKWAWRHHVLRAEVFDSLDDAVFDAGNASDYGDEALNCIESWDDQGYRKLSAGEALTIYTDQRDAEEAAVPPPEPVVGRLFVTSPDGKEICYSSFTAEDRLEEFAARLREHLGDRIRVGLLPHDRR